MRALHEPVCLANGECAYRQGRSFFEVKGNAEDKSDHKRSYPRRHDLRGSRSIAVATPLAPKALRRDRSQKRRFPSAEMASDDRSRSIFSGGEHTNKRLREHGFLVVQKATVGKPDSSPVASLL